MSTNPSMRPFIYLERNKELHDPDIRANHERKFGAVIRQLSRWFGPGMVR